MNCGKVKLVDKVYFTSPQLSLSEEVKIFRINDLIPWKNKLYYKNQAIEEYSLILFYDNEPLGEYSTRRIARKFEYFKGKLNKLEEANKFFPAPVIFYLGSKVVTRDEMMKIEIKKLANELFK
ncbi:MAG: hypothetical protein QXS37_01075 [Candidatus Aenigmatarchaeota archaeon]